MPANKKTIAGMARSYNNPVVGWARWITGKNTGPR